MNGTLKEADLEPPVGPPAERQVFKELDFFVESDHKSFAGRDLDIREVVARISTNRAFVLYGRSGLGKTSLLRAGVFPVVKGILNMRPIYVRVLGDPLADLQKALNETLESISGDDQQTTGKRNLELETLLEDLSKANTVVIVFDQFEEFFTRFDQRPGSFVKKRRERVAFINRICSLVLDRQFDLRVVFSLREDYLHTLDAFQRRMPGLLASAYRLLPLTATDARQAITRPLRDEKVAWDEFTVTRLVDRLAEFDFDSARLQVSCGELYRAAVQSPGETRIDTPSLESILGNGLHGIFHRYLDGAIKSLPSNQHLLVRLLFDVLFSADGTKYALSIESLTDRRHASGEDTKQVLDALACIHKEGVTLSLMDRPLLRREERLGVHWYELRHECLVEPIKQWLNANEEFANFRLVRDHIRANARTPDFRYHPDRLLSTDQIDRLVTPNREYFRLSAVEMDYMLYSVIYRQSPQAAWWMERRGWKASAALLRELLSSHKEFAGKPAAQLRDTATDPTLGSRIQLLAGAALAVRAMGRSSTRGVGKCVLTDSDPERAVVARSCLDLALDSRFPGSVCRAAGASFGILAHSNDFDLMRSKIGRFRCSPPIKELLADLSSEDLKAAGVNFWHRFHARRRREQRRFDSAAKEIRDQTARGIVEALAGGMGFMLVFLPFASWLIANFGIPVIDDDRSDWERWMIWGGEVGGLSLYTLLLGMGITKRFARQTTLVENDAWNRTLTRSLVLRLLCGLPAIAIWMVFDDVLEHFRIFPFVFLASCFVVGYIAFGWASLRLLTCLTTYSAELCLGLLPTPARVFTITFNFLLSATCFGLACFITIILSKGKWSSMVSVLLFSLVLMVCFLHAVLTGVRRSLEEVGSRENPGAPDQKRKRRHIMIAAFVVLCASVAVVRPSLAPIPGWHPMFSVGRGNGRNIITIFAHTWPVPTPTTRRFAGSPGIYAAIKDAGNAWIGGHSLDSGALCRFLPGDHVPITFSAPIFANGRDWLINIASGDRPAELNLYYMPVIETNDVTFDPAEGKALVNVTLYKRDKRNSVWEGTLTLRSNSKQAWPRGFRLLVYRNSLSQNPMSEASLGVWNQLRVSLQGYTNAVEVSDLQLKSGALENAQQLELTTNASQVYVNFLLSCNIPADPMFPEGTIKVLAVLESSSRTNSSNSVPK